MARRVEQRLVSIATVIALALGAGLTSAAGIAVPTATRHPSGVVILSGRPEPGSPLTEELAADLAAAATVSEVNQEDMAYPYVDRASNTIVAGVVSERGTAAVAGLAASLRSSATIRSPRTMRSRAALDAIMRTEIGPADDGNIVSAIFPDPENNRVIAEVTGFSDGMLWGFAERYGPDAVAVLKVDRPLTTPSSREADTSEFYGGAKITGCTAGFPWIDPSGDMMLTAGHCAPGGGSFWTPASSWNYVGTVAGGTEENWDSGVGTVLLPGQSTYRGDIAVIRLPYGSGTYPLMWVGGPISSSNRPVRAMWSRSPQQYDQYCTGGSTKGEVCGWVTMYSYAGYYYYSGTGEYAEHVWFGTKTGHCSSPGDSGGPVYTVRSDGAVDAKGIISGVTGPGGSDYYAGAGEAACESVYTDIWDAWSALPGWLQTT